LMLRRHRYPLRDTGQVHADGEPERENMVPSQVAVLTSFTDVQNNRLETQVMGWGAGEEAWTIEYHVLYGDPTAEPLWAELWELLSRQRYLERGGVDYIRSSAIDSGYAATSVYKFVAPRPIYMTPDGRNSYTWATKGRAGTGQVWPKKPGQSQLKNVPVYTVMVDDAKDIMSARLQNIEEPGPGYVHFPLDFGESYFRQLTAEQAFTRRDKKGFAHKVWELKKGRQRNEVWDTLVGNYAALCALYSIGFDLQGECEELARRTPWEPPAVQGEPAPPVAPPAPEVVAQAQQNGQWLRGGRRGKWLR
ncbi:MAG: terminase gpA endonuclease subunit, partial [Mycobacterium sp.]